MKTRKQINELKVEDLIKYPVWEFALDEENRTGQNERTVRPYHFPSPLVIRDLYLLVRADFTLSCGVTHIGYIKPVKLTGKRLMEPLLPYDTNPVILTEQGPVFFCYGMNKPEETSISESYRRLNCPSERVFPIVFRTSVEVIGGVSEGVLDGYLYIDNGSLNTFKLKLSDVKFVR